MRKAAILLFILSVSVTIYAKQNIKFHTITPRGGLSYDGILDIKQDSDGFIWIRLQNSLFRFDGYNYKSYNSSFAEGKSSNTFENIIIGNNGLLYVKTSTGLYIYNNMTDKFDAADDFSNDGSIYIDSNNTLWFSNNQGFGYINNNNEAIYPGYEGKKLPLNRRIFCETEDGIIFFSNYGQIYRYNKTTGKITSLLNINKEFDNAHIVDAKLGDNTLWVVTSKFRIFGIDLTSNSLIFNHEVTATPGINIKCIYPRSSSELWVGTINGLYIVNTETHEAELHQNESDNLFSLPHNSVWTISEDKNRNIWIGTFMGSVAFVSPYDSNLFKTYGLSERGLNKVPVSGFTDDGKRIWISTEGGGVNILDKATGAFSYLSQSNEKSTLSSNNTKSMVADKDGNIWISTFRGGLDCYNTKTGKSIFYKATADNGALLSDNLRKVVAAADSGLWIIYQEHTGTFSYFDFEKRSCSHHQINEQSKTDYIYDIITGTDNEIWLLSSNNLYRFNTNAHNTSTYELKSGINNSASTLCMTDDGTIWIGTFGNELIHFDTKTDSLSHFEGLLQGSITEIYSINHSPGKIWMGTNNGLYLFDIATSKCTAFNESDGSQGNVYYPLSTFKTTEGLLYFGGAGGFSIIDPSKVAHNPVAPAVIISDFLIDYESAFSNNRQKIFISPLNREAQITLSHNQQNFGFVISSSNYLNPGKNIFRYRLRNFDDRWITTDANSRTIRYSKIPPGTYYFDVMTANNDGVWGETSTVKIIRKQTPLLTAPFIAIYFLIASYIIYQLVSTYRKRKQLEIKLYKEEIEKQKNEEIHNNQLRFFTNVSHDLKTPLTLIMTTVNKMREEGMKEYYYKLLNSNSVRLLNLLNDLLDFRKMQDKNVKLRVTKGNFNSVIEKACSDFNELAAEKGIDYIIELNDKALETVPFDNNVVEKVILNLVNNSFKYTMPGGHIKVSTTTMPFVSQYAASHTVGELTTQSFASIIVSDTGIGISEKSISRVFDRFYRVESANENRHLGSGIGLALVKELVLLHRGDITIYSRREIGTDIVVRFPLDESQYTADELSGSPSEQTTQATVQPKPYPFIADEHTTEISKNRLARTILIAEDNDDLRHLLKSSLTDSFNVVDFENGRVALDYLKENDADLIISDIMMPDTDGISFCKSIKNNIETSHIPFILLTAKSGIDSRIEGGEAGADLYYEKPVDISLLKLSISNIFKQQEILREYYSKNYFADVSEITPNKEESRFLSTAVEIIEQHIGEPGLDVNFIAQQMNMSRSKLYSKIKALTGKSVIEFILVNRLRRAAKLLIENKMSIQEAMFEVGIESQSYFTTSFKKEFGMPPSKFVAQHKEKGS